MKKTLAVGGDHAGLNLKTELLPFLKEKGFEVKDFGPYQEDGKVDYPDFAHPVSNAVEQEQYDLGILICGSANGVAMTANKHQDIRAAVCWNKEIAELSRKHNNANILCLPARFLSVEDAKAIAESFLESSFEGGRHTQRIGKIPGNC